MSPSPLQELTRLCRAGDFEAARSLCERLLAAQPSRFEVQWAASQLYQQLGEFDRMLQAASAARALAPGHAGAALREVEGWVCCGRIDLARTALTAIELGASAEPALLQQVAESYLYCGRHADARRCHQRAVALEPDHAGYRYNLASSCLASGDIDDAEALLAQAIAIDPADLGALHQRSMLRRWTPARHHIDELSARLAALPGGHPGEVPLCYALAKEFEDLGDERRAFEHVQRGAAARRRRLAYRVQTDTEAMAQIARVFSAERLLRPSEATAPAATSRNARPWFVLGLPRSGTTLVERILGSHSRLASLGEIDGFAFALMRLTAGGPPGKLALIERSAGIDHGRLGEIYRDTQASYGVAAAGLIDKTPQNFLYLGLIALALPEARIVHLRRHPLDSCHAMFKTLFRMGYPYSYSLDDLGHYYLAYHRLMAHWRAALPGRFIDIDYETLVEDTEGTTRRMLDHGGLAWEAGTLEFHRSAAPVATASAVQVRQPVYRSSLRRWQAHVEALAPLAEFLTANGVDCG